MQLEYRSRKPILPSDLFSVICSIAAARSVGSSVDDLACLQRQHRRDSRALLQSSPKLRGKPL